MKPSTGRIVHLVDPQRPDIHHAAIVTSADPRGELVTLQVFPDPRVFERDGTFSYPPDMLTAFSEDTTVPGTWHWPEREG